MKKSKKNRTTEIFLATGNLHKIEEITAALQLPGLSFTSLKNSDISVEVDEDQPDFEGNAMKKAWAYYLATGLPSLADDSGLVIPALNGEPGVLSARYAGENSTSEALMEKVLNNLDKKEVAGEVDRSAWFECALVLYYTEGGSEKYFVANGKCHGTIERSPRGKSGFGYDPIFTPDGHTKTFAEMEMQQKTALSHRGLALENMVKNIEKMSK